MSCLVSAVTYVCEISKNKQTKNSCWPVFINLISCKVFRGSQVTSGPHIMCSHNNIFFYSGITYTAESIILLFALALGKKKKKKSVRIALVFFSSEETQCCLSTLLSLFITITFVFVFNLAQKVWSMSSMLINLGSSEGSRKRPSKTRMCFFVARFNLFIHYWFTGNCWKQPFH